MGFGSKREFSRAGPRIQRDCLSRWLVARGEAAAGGSLSKGSPAPQVCTWPVPSGRGQCLPCRSSCTPWPSGPLNPRGITERVGLRPRLAFGPHRLLQGLRSPTSSARPGLSLGLRLPSPTLLSLAPVSLPPSISLTHRCSFPGVPFPYLLGSCWPCPEGENS